MNDTKIKEKAQRVLPDLMKYIFIPRIKDEVAMAFIGNFTRYWNKEITFAEMCEKSHITTEALIDWFELFIRLKDGGAMCEKDSDNESFKRWHMGLAFMATDLINNQRRRYDADWRDNHSLNQQPEGR